MNRLTLAIATLLAPATAGAAVVTFQQNVGGYLGTRDTELRFVEPDLNTGSATSVSVDYDDGPGDVNPTHGLIGFDGIFGNAPGQVPPDSTINSATLTVVLTSPGSGWTYHRMLADWDENAATWNSFGGGVQADGVEAAIVPTLSDGIGDGNSNVSASPYVANLTADVQAFAAGVPNFGWAILPLVGGTNGIDFLSSESTGTTQPILTIDYTPIPEPTLGLGCLTVLSAVQLSRRRRGRSDR